MRRALLLVSACLLVGIAPTAAPAQPVGSGDLVGTWHVLVHYKDSGAPNADAKRWEDRIWVFEMEGSRLRWTDYPIVVFESQAGRFENTGANAQARVLDWWEPNQGQALQIQKGLEINPRGSRSKTLRGSDAKGWTSARRQRGYQSANVITFEETWTIEDQGGLPRFERLDVMGSAASESLEGRTIYTTKEVKDRGNVLEGSYDRDGTRRGSFRMTRAGATRTVGSKGEGPDYEQVEAQFYLEMGDQLFEGADIDEKAVRASIAAGTFTEDDRRAFAEQIQAAVQAEYERQGNDPMQHRLEIRNLVDKMVIAFVDGGLGLRQIRAAVKSGDIRP